MRRRGQFVKFEAPDEDNAATGDVQSDLAAILKQMDREQLLEVLTGLANDATYAEAIADQVARLQSRDLDAGPVDLRLIRITARAALKPEYDEDSPYDDYGPTLSGDLSPLFDTVAALVTAGEANAALPVLGVLTEEYALAFSSWDQEEIENSYDLPHVYEQLNDAWIRSLLSSTLPQKEREAWAEKLTDWADEISSIETVGEYFEDARDAALHGWDHPILKKMLTGGELQDEDYEIETADLFDSRLLLLQEQRRFDEMLHFARAVERPVAACIALIALGRYDEALASAREEIDKPSDIVMVSRALWTAGAKAQALDAGRFGLDWVDEQQGYDGPRPSLSEWVRDCAYEFGDFDLALRASEVAFRQSPTVKDYELIQELTGDAWPGHRELLLEQLRGPRNVGAVAADIFVREALWDDALAIADNCYSYEVKHRVLKAAESHRPERVFAIATRLAESIMNEGKSKYYDNAIAWLQAARSAYAVSGHMPEWRVYLQGLLAKHSRKYSLVPMLRTLN